jgi:dimethylamine/trimethylamine dehydrogenase
MSCDPRFDVLCEPVKIGPVTAKNCCYQVPHCSGMDRRPRDDRDMPVFARMCDTVHADGARAGCKFGHAGVMAANRYSRDLPLAPSYIPVALRDPVQVCVMDLSGIRALRRWHRDAGFDVIYVYEGHQLSTISPFLSRYRNRRSDAYGGGVEDIRELEALAPPQVSPRPEALTA